MRLKALDGPLFLAVKLIKAFDKRETGLKYFDPAEVKSIMVVSSTAIGDTLLSTPAIRAVRERYPRAKIMAHFNRKNMELFENNPDIDGIIPYYGGYKKFFRTIKEFRKHKFDVALIFHGNEPQATPMAYLSGARFIIKVPIPKKNGFLLSNRENGFCNPWDHHVIDVRLKTASFIGCMTDNKKMVMDAAENESSLIDGIIEKMGIEKDDRIIGFQLGAASKYKVWPEKYFIELGRKLLRNEKIRIVVIGSKQERKSCVFVAEETGGRAVSLAGEIPLILLRALLKKMDILVTNDTGPMHMAIALGTRTVSLFCPTNYRGVGPVQDMHLHKIVKKRRPCDPCVKKNCKKPFCMGLITVDETYKAVKELINVNDPLNHPAAVKPENPAMQRREQGGKD